jgi:hypothetical protein
MSEVPTAGRLVCVQHFDIAEYDMPKHAKIVLAGGGGAQVSHRASGMVHFPVELGLHFLGTLKTHTST